MHYLGGKSRVAATLASAILARREGRTRYVEPFLGAGSVAARVVCHFPDVHLSDAHPDLVMMWNAILNEGWEPKADLSKDEWLALRDGPPSPERAFAGFAYSYGGRWFHHYVAGSPHGRKGASRGELAAHALLAKANAIGPRTVACADYRKAAVLLGADTVVYADPPYEATFQHWDRERDFDSEAFWKDMDDWAARGALVMVSGHDAPPGWGYAWRARPRSTLGPSNSSRVNEYLFVRGSGYRRVA